MNHQDRFDQLLRACANGELTTDEREELDRLTERDGARRRALLEFAELHDALSAERKLQAAVMAPPEPTEETDEGYRRLVQAAARGEQDLRVRLLNPVPRVAGGSRLATASSRPRPGSRARRRLWAILAGAAAVLLVALLVNEFRPGPPPLDPNRPAPGESLGRMDRILVETVVTQQSRSVSWHDVAGARSYEAKILDEANAVVLVRRGSESSNEWQLSPQQYRLLKDHAGPLFLRVVARDGAALPLATTGDVRLHVR